MLFNSLDFALFLPIVFILYWISGKLELKIQNIVLLIASYTFYGWWDYRFLALILFSTIVDYYAGLRLYSEHRVKARQVILLLSLCANLGVLGFFKYYNFFVENFIEAFQFFGAESSWTTLEIVLPVGISFYTFQTMSYSIDIYKKRIEPTYDITAFACYVGFFPQLVAGPIERARFFLPQFLKRRVFNYDKAKSGLRQILWGLFKKMVIADNCATYVDICFQHSNDYAGSSLLLGACLFSFQIYCDFSGYTDIAIGTARLFGFELSKNFSYPYFAKNIAEFWRRWHISLTNWFRDYVYIPLGGSHVGLIRSLINVCIVFLVSAFWHGANWTFILWGICHFILYIPAIISRKSSKTWLKPPTLNSPNLLHKAVSIGLTFVLVTLAWIFFRAETVSHALGYYSNLFSISLWCYPEVLNYNLLIVFIFIGFMMIMEWQGRFQTFALETISLQWSRPKRHIFYYSLIFIIFYFYGNQQQFIYFQF